MEGRRVSGRSEVEDEVSGIRTQDTGHGILQTGIRLPGTGFRRDVSVSA